MTVSGIAPSPHPSPQRGEGWGEGASRQKIKCVCISSESLVRRSEYLDLRLRTLNSELGFIRRATSSE